MQLRQTRVGKKEQGQRGPLDTLLLAPSFHTFSGINNANCFAAAGAPIPTACSRRFAELFTHVIHSAPRRRSPLVCG